MPYNFSTEAASYGLCCNTIDVIVFLRLCQRAVIASRILACKGYKAIWLSPTFCPYIIFWPSGVPIAHVPELVTAITF